MLDFSIIRISGKDFILKSSVQTVQKSERSVELLPAHSLSICSDVITIDEKQYIAKYFVFEC